MFTKSETESMGVIGTQTVLLPAELAGGIVIDTEYGSVSRAGMLLQGGEVLAAGDSLSFAPASAGGTTYLNIEMQNVTFSGDYNDLDNKPDLSNEAKLRDEQIQALSGQIAALSARLVALELPILYRADFASMAAGDLNGRDDWTLSGQYASATTDSAGLHVAASMQYGEAQLLLHPLPAGAVAVRMQPIRNGNQFADVLLRAFHDSSSNRALGAWVYNGQLDWGLLGTDNSSLSSFRGQFGDGSNLLPLPSATNTEVEVLLRGGVAELRAWDAATGSRPDTPLDTHAVSGLNPTHFGLSTWGDGGSPVLLLEVAGKA